jgi:protein-S-isoprenylcysteine O-methyltransferase Ste14
MDLGRVLFRLRNLLASLPLVYALFATTLEWKDTWSCWAIAVALAALGVVMRAWATCHCGYSTGEKKTLAFTGPYAWIRNPLYVGNLLLILAGVVASGLEWFLPIAALWSFGIYACVVGYEEEIMLRKFGSPYSRYRNVVPAWLPRWKRVYQAAALPSRGLFPAIVRQSGNLLVLLPFALKEWHVFGLGSGY